MALSEKESISVNENIKITLNSIIPMIQVALISKS